MALLLCFECVLIIIPIIFLLVAWFLLVSWIKKSFNVADDSCIVNDIDIVRQTQEALAQAEEQNIELAAVREALADKETTVDQLREQVTSLVHEVASLSEAYTRLQVFTPCVHAAVSSC